MVYAEALETDGKSWAKLRLYRDDKALDVEFLVKRDFYTVIFTCSGFPTLYLKQYVTGRGEVYTLYRFNVEVSSHKGQGDAMQAFASAILDEQYSIEVNAR